MADDRQCRPVVSTSRPLPSIPALSFPSKFPEISNWGERLRRGSVQLPAPFPPPDWRRAGLGLVEHHVSNMSVESSIPFTRSISFRSDLDYQAWIKSCVRFGRVAPRIGNDAGRANGVIAAAVDVATYP